MRKIYLILLICFNISIFAQQKYFIFFKDKGTLTNSSISTKKIEDEVIKSLSKETIERRQKVSDDIITFEDYPINQDYLNVLENSGIKIIHKLNWFNVVSAYLTEAQINSLSKLPFIKEISKVKTFITKSKIIESNNSIPSFFKTEKDILDYGESYQQLAFSNIIPLHKYGITGENVIIGLLDTGFRWRSHPALANSKVLKEYDFIHNDTLTTNKPDDYSSQDAHGTYVMSVIGGKFSGKIYGSSYNSKFILAKTEDIRSETRVEEDNFVRALEWMEKLGVQVVSSSLGYNLFDDPKENYSYKDMNGKTSLVAKAYDILFQKGVLCFTSAGNEGNNNWKYITTPGDAFYVLTIGAVNNNGLLASFSSKGPTSDGRIKPDVVAQGVNVFGVSTDGSYIYQSGTSCSTPIAAGVGALVLSHYPQLSNIQIRDAFRQTANRASKPDTAYGWGAIDAVEILSFPYLIKQSTGTVLLKSFLVDKIDPGKVNISISQNGIDFISYKMNYSGQKNKFDILLPNTLPQFDKIKFFFTFTDSSGKSYRVPEADSVCYSMVIADKKVFNYEKTFTPVTNFAILPVYPNPYFLSQNELLKFKIQLPLEQNINIYLFDLLGRKVKTLIHNSNLSKGEHTFVWNGTNDENTKVNSGVYLLRIVGDNFISTQKFVLIK